MSLAKRKTGRRGSTRQYGEQGGRKVLAARYATPIGERLRAFVRQLHGSLYAGARALGITRAKLSNWGKPNKGGNVTAPDLASLAPLVERGLSLDWLWHGKGLPLWHDPGEVPGFADLLKRELVARTDATPEEIEVWWHDLGPQQLLEQMVGALTEWLPLHRKYEKQERQLAAAKAGAVHTEKDGVTIVFDDPALND